MADKQEQSSTSKPHFCAHCGTANEKSGYTCTRCGERLIEVDVNSPSSLGLHSCSRCGSANNSRAAYCWVCGSGMNDSVRIVSKPAPELEISSATAPRTYRPDLNPVSLPANDAAANPQSDAAGSSSDLKTEIPFSQQNHSVNPESSVENTSGTSDGEIPVGIKKWNWAAFLMPAVWGLFSGVPYTAILFGAALLPPTVQLIVMAVASIFLGVKGNELAWRGKKWRSVEHFRAFQKQWASWAVKLSIAVLVLLVLWVFSSGGA